MLDWLFHPKTFNWLLIALYIAAAVRWGFAGDWKQVWYFVGATILNVAVLRMAQ